MQTIELISNVMPVQDLSKIISDYLNVDKSKCGYDGHYELCMQVSLKKMDKCRTLTRVFYDACFNGYTHIIDFLKTNVDIHITELCTGVRCALLGGQLAVFDLLTNYINILYPNHSDHHIWKYNLKNLVNFVEM